MELKIVIDDKELIESISSQAIAEVLNSREVYNQIRHSIPKAIKEVVYSQKDNIINECIKRATTEINLSHQLYNLKPKAFYADGNWDLYKEGYNDCINDVIDLFEKAESCNEKSDVKNKSDTSCSKGVSLIPCNASDMEQINKFEKVALNENDVIIFTFVLADNEIDSNNEQLCSSTLCELSHLFEGVNGTVHLSKSEINSRIFECYVDVVDGNQTRNGEQYCRLIARAYVKKFLLSDNDIKEISNATFKESTLGAAVSERICGVCGNPVGKCNHNDYTKLLNATDAYEWNLFKKEN